MLQQACCWSNKQLMRCAHTYTPHMFTACREGRAPTAEEGKSADLS